jgi:A/G-specific adenine glycosylase
MALSDTEVPIKSKARAEAEEKMRKRLHAWFQAEGRDLPWRRTTDPYAILVSEFMLQQTTVVAVIPYFERWMQRFPTVKALADATEADVLSLWQGLGYYSRARNLQKAAQAIVQRHDGIVPRSRDLLRELPGIGDYTAAAVASFAFDAVEPVVDANIARVLTRLFDWRTPIDDAKGKAFLQETARSFLPEEGGRLHTSAIMELGALVCTSKKPRCLTCPIGRGCLADEPTALPVKRPRPKVELVVDKRLFIADGEKVWLEQSTGPRWIGLWLLPAAAEIGEQPDHIQIYPITRYRVTMRVFAAKARQAGWKAFPKDDLPAMPSPHRRAVAAMLKKRHT